MDAVIVSPEGGGVNNISVHHTPYAHLFQIFHIVAFSVNKWLVLKLLRHKNISIPKLTASTFNPWM